LSPVAVHLLNEISWKGVDVLNLSDEDTQSLYDLWGKSRSASPPDLTEYINDNQAARIALRIAKEKASDADWQRFICELERKEKR